MGEIDLVYGKYRWPEYMVGILLDDPYKGDSNGIFQGVDYFKANHDEAAFLPLEEVSLAGK